MIQGWVKLHRAIVEHEIATDANAMLVFIHLLCDAQYRDKTNRRFGYKLGAGESDLTIGQLEERTGLSTKQVRGALERLERYGTLERAALGARSRRRWKLVNWASYQGEEFDRAASRAGQGQGKGRIRATPQEDQEREEVPRAREAQSVPKVRLDEDGDMDLSGVTHVGEILIAEFDDPHWSFQHFKSAYPTGNGMGKAKQLWMALSPQDRARAYAGCLTYAKAVAATPKEKRRFIPAAGKWLDEIRWMDDIADSVLCLQADDRHGPTRDISQMNSRERELCLLEEDNSDLF